MSRDPIGERGGRNIYSFVINRPISAIDKMGLIVIYIGGAMEGTLETLAEFKKEVGADVSFEWSQKSEVVARIKAAVKANPCEPVIVIGHSWGGDTAMDVVDDFEGDKCMKCLYVVTLDPVSQFDPDTWFGGPNPGSQVTEWINIAQPATFMDVVVDIPVVGWIVGWFWAGGSAIVRDNDGIATGGGQWNSESQATFDIPAITPNGEVLNHHDVDGMIHLELPGKNQTVIQYIEKLKKRDCCQ